MSVLGALQVGRAEPGANRRIGRLFMAGSFCFAVASLPFMADFENDVAGLIYFVGSIFFTAAGAETFRTVEPGDRLDLVASAVQLAGTIMFNLNTYAALDSDLDRHSQNHLIWLPDAVGSLCFLIASAIAVAVVRRARSNSAGGDRARRRDRLAQPRRLGVLRALGARVGGAEDRRAAEHRGRDLGDLRAARSASSSRPICSFRGGNSQGLRSRWRRKNGSRDHSKLSSLLVTVMVSVLPCDAVTVQSKARPPRCPRRSRGTSTVAPVSPWAAASSSSADSVSSAVGPVFSEKISPQPSKRLNACQAIPTRISTIQIGATRGPLRAGAGGSGWSGKPSPGVSAGAGARSGGAWGGGGGGA